MSREALKKFLGSTKAAALEFILFFGAGWGLIEPLGLKGSPKLWAALAVVAVISAITVDWIRIRLFLLPACRDAQQAAQSKPIRGCCVTGDATGVCPLGIKKIYNRTDETIRESMANAQHEFVWFGLSAFNVVHNNLDILRELHGRKITFYLVSNDLQSALDKHDSRRPDVLTPFSSKELLDKGVELVERLNAELGNKAELHLKRYKLIHTFRLILVDNRQAYVSFYEQKSDALRSHQILLEDGPDVRYPILPWFREFVERVGAFHSYEQTLGVSDPSRQRADVEGE
jgi:hypothetical protein